MPLSPASNDASVCDVSLSELQEAHERLMLVRKMAVCSFILAFPITFQAVQKGLHALLPAMLSAFFEVFIALQLIFGMVLFLMSLGANSRHGPLVVRDAGPLLSVALGFLLPGYLLLFVCIAFVLVKGLLGLLHK